MSERSDSIYLVFTEGRFVRAVRLVALAVIVGTAFIGRPHPTLTGDGLVILISLVVAAATQVALTLAPSGSSAMRAITVLAALSTGVVAGYEPSVGMGILLIFVGRDRPQAVRPAGRGGRAAPGRCGTSPGGARPGRRPGRAGQRGPGDPRHPGPQSRSVGPPARRAGCSAQRRDA